MFFVNKNTDEMTFRVGIFCHFTDSPTTGMVFAFEQLIPYFYIYNFDVLWTIIFHQELKM